LAPVEEALEPGGDVEFVLAAVGRVQVEFAGLEVVTVHHLDRVLNRPQLRWGHGVGSPAPQTSCGSESDEGPVADSSEGLFQPQIGSWTVTTSSPANSTCTRAYAARTEFNITARSMSFLYRAKQRGLTVGVGYDPEGRHDAASGRRLLPAPGMVTPLMRRYGEIAPPR